ncbi:hypothetical protein [Bradyrhizobium sp. Leo121]|uniref:hypothetical protein n=1 Tax=Bradyrhizobium sp. Leo121 TaxID=1571195 RepID=UPI00102A339F|nr:hypothetical protein [Bradyrhizobium sp. Leo121]RZN30496.1 hypothetical protein CWO90_20380 [Bradyrhizobium sp. Leo121]
MQTFNIAGVTLNHVRESNIYCRTSIEWRRTGREIGLRNGQAAARRFAKENGHAIIRWNDGHATLYIHDDDRLRKIRFTA